MESGSLICTYCGSEQRSQPARSREAPRRQTAEVVEVQAGPTCREHEGMPIAGQCPRCKKDVCYRCAPEAVRDDFTCSACVGLTVAHKKAPDGAVCAQHPKITASFICARCGSFACPQCRALSSDGLCTRCETNVGVKAGVGARIGAHLIDSLAVFIVPLMVVAFASSASKGEGDFNPLLIIPLSVLALSPIVVQVWAQAVWAQSIGKRLLGIKVVRANGQPIELWRVLLLRNLLMSVMTQLCGIIAIVDIVLLFSANRQTLHDLIADSIVIEVSDR